MSEEKGFNGFNPMDYTQILDGTDPVDFTSLQGFFNAAKSLQCLPDDNTKVMMLSILCQMILSM